jgi:autotransporter-associated beta strand protein
MVRRLGGQSALSSWFPSNQTLQAEDNSFVRANRQLGGYLFGAFVLTAVLPIAPSWAVVTAGGNANTTAPADDPGFANVGTTGGASIIYLGNGWAITAAHVYLLNPGTPAFSVGPNGYQVFPIANTVGANYGPNQIGEFGPADLRLVNLTIAPALPALSIDTRAPSAGDAVTMIGNGRPQAGLSQEYWNVATPSLGANWTWTSTGAPSTVNPIPSSFFPNYYGGVDPPVPAGTYQVSAVSYGGGQQIRWGLNQITATTVVNSTIGFYTTFNDPRFAPGGPTASGGNEAQASIGDSGGAVFYKNGTTWKLDGMMIANDLYPNKPDSFSAAFGEPSYMADLTAYRSTIMRVITPLPWTGATNSNWDTSSHNWVNSVDSNQTYYDVSSPTFNDLGVASSSVVIQAAGVLPAAVSFNNSTVTSYTFSDSGTSTLGITGSTGITKTGGGLVTLAGANSFTGPVQVSAGRINLQNNNALGASSGVVVSSGAALELQNNVSAGTSSASSATTIPLTINGAGLAANPAGALNSVGGTNSYAGVITIGSGGATINSAFASGALLLTGGISTAGNPLTFSGPGTISVTSNISGGGSVTKTSTGYLNLTGANSYTGGTSISGGILLTDTLGDPSNPVVVSAASGVTSALVLNSSQSVGSLAGTVGSSGLAVVSIGPLTSFTVNQATNTTFAGTLQNSGTFVKSGAGTLEIDGAPQLGNNAAVQVNGGTLKFSVASPATSSVGSGVSVSVAAGATLQLAGTSSSLSGANYANIANSSQAAGGGLVVTGTGQQVGAITGTGNTNISAGSDLTVSSIIQNALIIGGTAGSPATLTIRSSSSTGATLPSNGPDTSTAAASTQWLTDALAAMAAGSSPQSAVAIPSSIPQDSGSLSSSSESAGGNGVPEPSTVGLLLIAAGAWAVSRIRRSRS